MPEIVVLKNGAATFGEKVAASAFGANISEKAAAALKSLNESGLQEIFSAALLAARDRSRELAQG